ncbi:FecR domain-containing protein [Sphingomonas sp. 1P06PA]|uniref:FecR family protein n=1 Tax=Sphingomonas sp. 1P06PA TaxID=554121 RepID=UPI0039A70D6B
MRYRPTILLAAAIASAALAAVPAIAEIGRVKRAVGAAFVQRGTARLPATPGLPLKEGDLLVTGPDGRISLAFIDNSRFSAGPNSRVSIDEFRFDDTTHKGQFVTRVDRGTLGVVSGQIAKENRDGMRVRTPTSLLGVRGTRFVVQVGQ